MTNGELFIRENPNIETKVNGSCVWIYYFDCVNHYTIPTEWWNKEIGLFEDIKSDIADFMAEIPTLGNCKEGWHNSGQRTGLEQACEIIDNHIRNEVSHETD